MFDYADPALRVADNLGFAGFRVHAPINRPDYYDEVCVFLGASYFRAVAKGQVYGLSARGLAIGTGDPRGEEFARFRAFWLERPQPGVNALVIHALLDSKSTTGAYRFTVRPGEETVFDVESVLYPRVDIAEPAIAPLTGMFFFDANDRIGVDDYRPAAHDSEGLSLWTGRNEQIWRPLANPRDLQFSAFVDTNPHGFGLLQRKRAFADYQDLEVSYEKRPSLWIEPIGDWGQGAVDLVEIPTAERDQRQRRRLLAAEGQARREGRIQPHLSHALGLGPAGTGGARARRGDAIGRGARQGHAPVRARLHRRRAEEAAAGREAPCRCRRRARARSRTWWWSRTRRSRAGA